LEKHRESAKGTGKGNWVPFQFPSSSLPSSLRGFPAFFQGKCVATFFKETTKMCSLLKKKICNALYLEKHKGIREGNWKGTGKGKGNWETQHFVHAEEKELEKHSIFNHTRERELKKHRIFNHARERELEKHSIFNYARERELQKHSIFNHAQERELEKHRNCNHA